MFISNRRRGGLQRRGGLGTVATQVNGSIVLSSDPVKRSAPVRAIGPARPTRPTNGSGSYVAPGRPAGWAGGSNSTPAWGASGPQQWSAANSPYGSSPTNPTGSSLATAQALLQTNPGLLNQTQWQMLQAAGLVASTVPYSSASQINTPLATTPVGANDPQCLALGMTGGPYPNCTPAVAATSSFDIGTMLSTAYLGLPLYVWLAGGLGAYLLLGHKSGRR